MAEIISFMRHGWKSVWQVELILLFSALPLCAKLFSINIQVVRAPSLVEVLVNFVALYASMIGVPYIAWNISLGREVSLRDVIQAIRKFIWRVLGCSFLVVILILPLCFIVFAASYDASTKTIQVSDTTILVLMSLSIFSALLDFSFFSLFASNSGIRQSLSKAWSVFAAHFGVLAVLEVILALIYKVSTALSAGFAVFIASGFEMSSLAAVNYINPSDALGRNLLFVLINGLGGTLLSAFSTCTLAFAYLKYNGAGSSPARGN